MKHIFYATLFCSFSASAMEWKKLEEPAHQRLQVRTNIRHNFGDCMSRYGLSHSPQYLAGYGRLENRTKVTLWPLDLIEAAGTFAYDERVSSFFIDGQEGINTMLLSRNSESLFLGQGREVKIWDVHAQKEKMRITIPLGELAYSITEHPTEQTLAVIGTNCHTFAPDDISFIDIRSGKATNYASLSNRVVALSYSQTGNVLALANYAPGNYRNPITVNMIEATTLRSLKQVSPQKRAPLTNPITRIALAFDENNAIHYGSVESSFLHDSPASYNNGIIISENIDTGAISRSDNQLNTVSFGFVFEPNSRQFSSISKDLVTLWKSLPLSHTALSILARAKKDFFGTLAESKKEIEDLYSPEREWVKSHLRNLASCALEDLGSK